MWQHMGYIVCGILLFLNIIAVSAAVWNNRRMKLRLEKLKKEREEREYQIEYDKKKAEIVSLQSQINPHFLYNTLEVIRSEAIINRDFEAAEMAEALANYFRYNISKKKDIVTVGEELDNIDNYISIQKRRFGDKIDYEIRYDSDEAQIRSALMPKLTLQPLVENAIYHGIEKKAKGGTVTVHAVATKKRLIIRVVDDGPGMDHETLEAVRAKLRGGENELPGSKAAGEKHGGIALANVNQRIQMLYGAYYGITFASTKGLGTEAEVTLPYYTE